MYTEVGRQTALDYGVRIGAINTEITRQDQLVADDWEERVAFDVEVLVDQRIHTTVPFFSGPPKIVVKVDEAGGRILAETIDPADPARGIGTPAEIAFEVSDAIPWAHGNPSEVQIEAGDATGKRINALGAAIVDGNPIELRIESGDADPVGIREPVRVESDRDVLYRIGRANPTEIHVVGRDGVHSYGTATNPSFT